MISDQGLIVVDVSVAEIARTVLKTVTDSLGQPAPEETTIGGVQIFYIKRDWLRYTGVTAQWGFAHRYVTLPIRANPLRSAPGWAEQA